MELPCIVHANGPDLSKLVSTLKDPTDTFDYIIITSPEAAHVFIKAWEEATQSSSSSSSSSSLVQNTKLVAVGKATEETLLQHGLHVDFVPTKATAKTLVQELPPSTQATREGRFTKVLYPASVKAKPTLQNGLNERGTFHVMRLDTYDTIPATWDKEQIRMAQTVRIACFASPSAVEAWVLNYRRMMQEEGEEEQHDEIKTDMEKKKRDGNEVLAACIGETSAQACREMQWNQEDIFYPEKPGVEGWSDVVADALERIVSQE